MYADSGAGGDVKTGRRKEGRGNGGRGEERAESL